jgi:prefoldin subunit 5
MRSKGGSELRAEADSLKQERNSLTSEKNELTTQQNELNEREARVKALELEAESGFTGRFKQWLNGFDEQRAALQKEIDDLRKEALSVRQDCDTARRAAHNQLIRVKYFSIRGQLFFAVERMFLESEERG